MSRLFQPATVGALSLKNHVVMAPLTRQRADVHGVPQPHVADYYRQRAGAGLIIAEGTQPSLEGQGYCRTPGIHAPEQIAAWRTVTDAVHGEGTFMFLQIMHAGRIAHSLNRQVDSAPVAPSAIRPAGQIWTDQQQMVDHPTPRALETAEIAGVIETFVQGARNAVAAGFDGVELHAANGYLLNQFLSSNTNQRTDRYGGSLENRIRMVVETAQATVAAIGANRTGIRISPGHMFNDLIDENPIETHTALLDALAPLGLAYVHLMLPHSFDARLNNAGDPDALLRTIRRHVPGRLIAAGNLTPASADALLTEGLIDLAVFGRPFIANPDFVQRVQRGLALSEADPTTFYTPGPKGYSDYPAAA